MQPLPRIHAPLQPLKSGQLADVARLLVEAVALCTQDGRRDRMFTAAAILGFFRHIERSDGYYRRRVVLPGLQTMSEACCHCAERDGCVAAPLLDSLSAGLRLVLEAS